MRDCTLMVFQIARGGGGSVGKGRIPAKEVDTHKPASFFPVHPSPPAAPGLMTWKRFTALTGPDWPSTHTHTHTHTLATSFPHKPFVAVSDGRHRPIDHEEKQLP